MVATDDRRFFDWLSAQEVLIETVFDVGSAKGGWSRMMSRYFPKATYHLFDPRPLFDAELKAKLEANASNYKALIVSKAVAAEGGTVEYSFHTESGSGPGSSLLFRDRDKPGQRIVEVEAVTLDEYAEAAGVERVDFLKMDVQGGELEALKGAQHLLKDVRFVFLETWLTTGYGEKTPHMLQVFDFLRPFGIIPLDFLGKHYNKRGTLNHIDVVYHNVNRSGLPRGMYRRDL